MFVGANMWNQSSLKVLSHLSSEDTSHQEEKHGNAEDDQETEDSYL